MTTSNRSGTDSGARDGSSVRVLIIEDDENTRRVLVLLLQLRGYEVVETGRPDEALRIADEQRLDLVVSDIQLPGMSGIELAEAITGRDGAPPMIAITSGSSDVVERAKASGHFRNVLRKPVDVNRLLDLAHGLTVKPGDSPA